MVQSTSICFYDCAKHFYVQDGLELSTEQQRSMLDARQRLLKALITIRQDREKIILELGLALLQKKSVSPADAYEFGMSATAKVGDAVVIDPG